MTSHYQMWKEKKNMDKHGVLPVPVRRDRGILRSLLLNIGTCVFWGNKSCEILKNSVPAAPKSRTFRFLLTLHEVKLKVLHYWQKRLDVYMMHCGNVFSQMIRNFSSFRLSWHLNVLHVRFIYWSDFTTCSNDMTKFKAMKFLQKHLAWTRWQRIGKS